VGENSYNTFMENIYSFPLWIKQAIYISLSNDLKKYLSHDFISAQQDELFHVYQPKLSVIGLQELATKDSAWDDDIYTFLDCCKNNMNLVEIALAGQFSMEEMARAFTFCIEQKYFTEDVPMLVSSLAGFISGKYRTGEYFIRAGKMTIDDLEKVLARQQELQEKGKHVFIAELMVQMGIIKEKDMKSIMLIKEESCKRFLLDENAAPSVQNSETADLDLVTQKQKLQEENEILKVKLSRVLTFIK
jgi:hypothetical protein